LLLEELAVGPRRSTRSSSSQLPGPPAVVVSDDEIPFIGTDSDVTLFGTAKSK
jgi:hypothetical protein